MNACAALITRGDMKGQPATGTTAGANRHRRAGEPVCDACQRAVRLLGSQRRKIDPDAHRQAVRRYTELHGDDVAARGRRWREANRDVIRERQRARYRANSSVLRERRRERYAADRDGEAARRKAWRDRNRDKVRALSRRHSRLRRARLAAVLVVPFSEKQLAQRMSVWGGRCWMCSGPFEEVDHVIPLARGGPHCLSNLRPACVSCNRTKGAEAVGF